MKYKNKRKKTRIRGHFAPSSSDSSLQTEEAVQYPLTLSTIGRRPRSTESLMKPCLTRCSLKLHSGRLLKMRIDIRRNYALNNVTTGNAGWNSNRCCNVDGCLGFVGTIFILTKMMMLLILGRSLIQNGGVDAGGGRLFMEWNEISCRRHCCSGCSSSWQKKIENKKATSYVVDSFSNHHHLDMLSVV